MTIDQEELVKENTTLKQTLKDKLPELEKNVREIKALLSTLEEYIKQGSWFQSPSEKMQESMNQLNENLKSLRSEEFNERVQSIHGAIKSIEDLIKDK